MAYLRRWSLLMGAVLALALPPARAQQPEAAPAADMPKVTLELDRTEIREALRLIGEQTGLDFVVADSVKGTMTARFVDQPLDRVLRLIAVTLDVAVDQVDGVYLLKPVRRAATEAETAAAAAAAAALPQPVAAPPAEGAGALLPGQTPQTPLSEAGTPASPLAGAPGEALPAGTPTGAAGAPGDARMRGEIPLNGLTPQQAANLFGGGYVDAAGRYHPYQQPVPGQGANGFGQRGNTLDPYRNLPPEARVTRNGAILMPNGSTILPSGVIVAPDGTVIQPGYRPYYQVPWGTNPDTLQNGYYPYGYYPNGYPYQNQGGTLQGNIGGFQFGLGQNGGVVVPPTLQLGPNAQLMLPGVGFNGNGIQVGPQGQTGGYPYYYPNQGYLSGTAPQSWYNYREYNGQRVTP